jgi:hypothetical protein
VAPEVVVERAGRPLQDAPGHPWGRHHPRPDPPRMRRRLDDVHPALYVIDNCDLRIDPRSYEKPIAVLTGPGGYSADDQVALRMTYHPHAQLFGKPTDANFGYVCNPSIDPAWTALFTCDDAYRINAPHTYLTHHDLPVDQPVWLPPDDVAQGQGHRRQRRSEMDRQPDALASARPYSARGRDRKEIRTLRGRETRSPPAALAAGRAGAPIRVPVPARRRHHRDRHPPACARWRARTRASSTRCSTASSTQLDGTTATPASAPDGSAPASYFPRK